VGAPASNGSAAAPFANDHVAAAAAGVFLFPTLLSFENMVSVSLRDELGFLVLLFLYTQNKISTTLAGSDTNGFNDEVEDGHG
jgi:hypothetical protein